MTFNTCEQWMMYCKAITFNDQLTADLILKTKSPKEQKALGRAVKNFDDEMWMQHAYDVVLIGNLAKFSQHTPSMEALKATRGKTLVEASPYDKRWGIGMKEGDTGIEDPANWKGENLLGKAITEVRQLLFGE